MPKLEFIFITITIESCLWYFLFGSLEIEVYQTDEA